MTEVKKIAWIVTIKNNRASHGKSWQSMGFPVRSTMLCPVVMWPQMTTAVPLTATMSMEPSLPMVS